MLSSTHLRETETAECRVLGGLTYFLFPTPASPRSKLMDKLPNSIPPSLTRKNNAKGTKKPNASKL